MEIIKRGAEALLYLDLFEGEKVLVKERIKKNYRLPEIDVKLRKLRTRSEAKLLTEARKCGVMTPKIIYVDENNFKIFMEFVDGVVIKEFLNRAGENEIKDVCYKIGKSIGKLHSHDIIHGDLTTSNMIIKNNYIYFIDFGLGGFSKRIEDKAVDLNLLYEALKSTHSNVLEVCWNEILKGYKEEYSEANEVINQIKEIEKRGRYVKRNEF